MRSARPSSWAAAARAARSARSASRPAAWSPEAMSGVGSRAPTRPCPDPGSRRPTGWPLPGRRRPRRRGAASPSPLPRGPAGRGRRRRRQPPVRCGPCPPSRSAREVVVTSPAGAGSTPPTVATSSPRGQGRQGPGRQGPGRRPRGRPRSGGHQQRCGQGRRLGQRLGQGRPPGLLHHPHQVDLGQTQTAEGLRAPAGRGRPARTAPTTVTPSGRSRLRGRPSATARRSPTVHWRSSTWRTAARSSSCCSVKAKCTDVQPRGRPSSRSATTLRWISLVPA